LILFLCRYRIVELLSYAIVELWFGSYLNYDELSCDVKYCFDNKTTQLNQIPGYGIGLPVKVGKHRGHLNGPMFLHYGGKYPELKEVEQVSSLVASSTTTCHMGSVLTK
jgi:hypothetical protein